MRIKNILKLLRMNNEVRMTGTGEVEANDEKYNKNKEGRNCAEEQARTGLLFLQSREISAFR